jgi:hypothetical protein
MKKTIFISFLSVSGAVWAQQKPATRANAAEKPAATGPISEQDRKIEILAEEVEKLKAGRELFPAAKESGRYGYGPAASKVYEINQGVSIGGYGEFLYNKYARSNESGNDSNQNDKIDSVRQIIYAGYKFNDKFVFNSEIEFEHAGNGGNVYTEFATIDYLHHPMLNFKAGLMLLPMGIYNEMHEAPTFLASTRPLTETLIMPSTWRENGAGIFGQIGDFSYKLYGVSSMNAASDPTTGVKSPNFTSQGFRGGRQRGAEAIANEFSGVLRVDYSGVAGSTFGVSAYYGKSGQADLHVHETTIADAHADVRIKGLYLRSVVSFANLTGADRLRNAGTGIGPADQMYGAYVEVGYDVLRFFETEQELYPHIRVEKIDTQYKVAAGNVLDARYKQDVLTFGLAYKPIRQIIAKVDYSIYSNKAETGVNQLNFGLGYLF